MFHRDGFVYSNTDINLKIQHLRITLEIVDKPFIGVFN